MENSISSMGTQDIMLMERTDNKPVLFTDSLQNSICLSNNSELRQYTPPTDSLSKSIHSLSESELVVKDVNPRNTQSSSDLWFKIDNIERKIARIDDA